MKYLLTIFTLFSHISLHAMEIKPTKFTVNKDSILHELNTIPTYNKYQTLDLHATFDCLVRTLSSLKYLQRLEQKCPKPHPKPWWNQAWFHHWLHWYEAEIRTLIIDSTKRKDYYLHDETILHDAVLHDNRELLRFALQIGIKPSSCKCSTLPTVKDPKIAQLLLDHGENINKLDSIGLNILMREVSSELTRFYLEKKADVNFVNWRGTALHWHVFHDCISHNKNRLQNTQLLIDAKVPINQLNKDGETVLDKALKKIQFWMSHPEYQKPFQELVELLRKNGALTAEELQNQNKKQE